MSFLKFAVVGSLTIGTVLGVAASARAQMFTPLTNETTTTDWRNVTDWSALLDHTGSREAGNRSNFLWDGQGKPDDGIGPFAENPIPRFGGDFGVDLEGLSTAELQEIRDLGIARGQAINAAFETPSEPTLGGILELPTAPTPEPPAPTPAPVHGGNGGDGGRGGDGGEGGAGGNGGDSTATAEATATSTAEGGAGGNATAEGGSVNYEDNSLALSSGDGTNVIFFRGSVLHCLPEQAHGMLTAVHSLGIPGFAAGSLSTVHAPTRAPGVALANASTDVQVGVANNLLVSLDPEADFAEVAAAEARLADFASAADAACAEAQPQPVVTPDPEPIPEPTPSQCVPGPNEELVILPDGTVVCVKKLGSAYSLYFG